MKIILTAINNNKLTKFKLIKLAHDNSNKIRFTIIIMII